jgi:hypothetical protein
MHYGFPGGLILKPEQYSTGLSPAGGLSDHDVAQVRLFYPPLSETSYVKLEPFASQTLNLAPAEQKNFTITPQETRDYTIQTFGRSDVLMVLFEDQNGTLTFVDGDDDSGSDLNAKISVRLQQGRKYVLRVRMYLEWATGQTAIMLW